MTKLRTNLMNAVATESVHDWRSNLGYESLRKQRVLMRKLVALGIPEVDELLREHYGIPKEKSVTVELPEGILAVDVKKS